MNNANHNNPIDELLRLLTLEKISDNEFQGALTSEDWQRVFGGQVIAQGLIAACHTISDDRLPNSLHAYFARPGNPKKPINFNVTIDRDGQSFSLRRLSATQDNKVILNMACSFHIYEDGLNHQFEIPNVTPPQDLKNEVQLYQEMFDQWDKDGQNISDRLMQHLLRPRAIEFRPIIQDRYVKSIKSEPQQSFWFKASSPIINDQKLQRAALAYATDMMFLSTCMLPHGVKFSDKDLTVASLDHALWFHEDVDINEWLLYVQDSPWTGHSRGMNRGLIYNQAGKLIASVAQEALIRKEKGREEPAPEKLYYGD